MNNAKLKQSSRNRASGSNVGNRSRGGLKWSPGPAPHRAPRFIGPLWKDGSRKADVAPRKPVRKPATITVATQTDSTPSIPSKVPSKEEFGAGGEVAALAAIRESLQYRLPELHGFGIEDLDVKWTWMGAEYRPRVFSEARVEYRFDPPMNVSSPLYIDNADVEQRYARCHNTVRDLADMTSLDPDWIHPLVASDAYRLKCAFDRMYNWAWDSSCSVVEAAMSKVHRRMLRQVAWDGLTKLSSTAPPTTGLRYWVRGEVVGESGISRSAYSVVGESAPNWFSGSVKYRRELSLDWTAR